MVLPHAKDETADLCGLWVTLHAVFRQWSLARPDAPERAEIEAHVQRQLSELSAVSAQDWAALIALQGLTPLSLAAYSWCQGAHLKGMLDLWGQVYDAAEAAPDTAFEGLRFTNPTLLPAPRVTRLMESGFIHGWHMRLLSHIWAGQDLIHDVDQQFKPEIKAWFRFVAPKAI